MENTNTKTTARKAEYGWCRSHEGMHNRLKDCTDWMFSQPLMGCDSHGKRPHRQDEQCVNPSEQKADPFHGF